MGLLLPLGPHVGKILALWFAPPRFSNDLIRSSKNEIYSSLDLLCCNRFVLEMLLLLFGGGGWVGVYWQLFWCLVQLAQGFKPSHLIFCRLQRSQALLTLIRSLGSTVFRLLVVWGILFKSMIVGYFGSTDWIPGAFFSIYFSCCFSPCIFFFLSSFSGGKMIILQHWRVSSLGLRDSLWITRRSLLEQNSSTGVSEDTN